MAENELGDLVNNLMNNEIGGEKANQYEPEANNTGVAKNFMIRCPRCRWARLSSGVAADLADLHEVNQGCVNCGKWRQFKCPKCGRNSPMKRMKGNT
jgi:hypothetical protein